MILLHDLKAVHAAFLDHFILFCFLIIDQNFAYYLLVLITVMLAASTVLISATAIVSPVAYVVGLFITLIYIAFIGGFSFIVNTLID